MKRIGVVSVARSDYGIYRPLLRHLHAAPDLDLQLIVSGAHLAREFGMTIREIEQDGFPIVDRVEMLLAGDSPTAVAKSIGVGVIGFAESLARRTPDLLMLLGDRFEMAAAGLAALPFNVPLAHVHGGESTEGAFDEAIRHALTKMSHLHFVSTDQHGDRVRQMGEEPWRVTVTGALGLDAIRETPRLSAEELSRRLEFPLDPAPLLVTFHPVTLARDETPQHIDELMAALDASALPVIFTWPNEDPGGSAIAAALERYVATHARACARRHLGGAIYLSLLPHVAAMVGNSSSGIIEAASVELPVVDIGERQAGRLRGRNVITVPCERGAIAAAIREATSAAFRAGLAGLVNPYGDGQAAPRMLDVLRQAPDAATLLTKRFHDLKPY